MSQTLPGTDQDVALLEMAAQIDPQTLRAATEDLEAPSSSTPSSGDLRAIVDLAIPVYNEEHILEDSILRLRRYLDESFPFATTICIVDNASTDGTWEVASRLAEAVPGVTAQRLERKGRGYALRCAWLASRAEIVAYMDVDLSTDLRSLLPLVAPLLSGGGDVAIGSRLAHGAHVVRGPKRELISRAYNLLLKVALRGHFSDAQCGFKALRRETALKLLPLVEDEEWFFDTELLITAERLGMHISEVPVNWVDDTDSRVKVFATAVEDLRGVWRISHGRSRRLAQRDERATPHHVTADQLFRFAGVGAISTLFYLLLFTSWRIVMGNFAANALALAICTLCNLALHNGLAKRMNGQNVHGRFVAVATGLFVVSLGLTTLALAIVHTVASSSLPLTLLALTAANAVAVVLRFAVLRAWIFRPEVSNSAVAS
jgi:glycosyltransferase involved in cell wall biosynthesis